MQPILFEVPGFGWKIHAYGLMLLLACFGAMGITAWRAKREKLDPNIVYELAIWLFLGGVIGARALYVFQYRHTMHQFSDLFQSWQGGNIFYGCILGGLTGSLLYWRRRRFPFWPIADAVAPGLAVGIALGRFGCFLNGCCYGAVCDYSWSIRFPAGSHAWFQQVDQGLLAPAALVSLPVYPTQLYAVLAGIVLLILLTLYYPRRRRDGEVMALLMILYPLTRWPIEVLRGDDSAYVLGMTMSQLISLVLLFAGLFVWNHTLRQGPQIRLVDHHLDSQLSPNIG
jgi:phosphatidylglycerol:prolipoprotein diacylglycerol transferase